MKQVLWILMLCGSLSACSWITGESDELDLQVISLQKLKPSGFEQGFELGLKVMNPGDKPLAIKGLVFDLDLDGYRLVSGVYSEVPEIAPYSEVNVTAHASISLLNSLRFFNELMMQSKTAYNFKFRARVDVDTWWSKSVVIKREGELRISPESKAPELKVPELKAP